MKFLIMIWIIVVLLGLFFISLINLETYGISGLILAGISSFVLYRIFRFIFKGYKPERSDDEEPSDGRSSGPCDPLDYIILGNIAGETNQDDWDKW